MANVKFLRGLHDKLPKGSAIQEGAFYLTSDTKRLYIGEKDSSNNYTLTELNKSVTTVSNVESLKTITARSGQFYYAIAENVLCVYDPVTNPDTPWVQINKNTDTTNSSIDFSTSFDVTNKKEEIVITLEDSTGASIEDTFQVAVGDNITIEDTTETSTVDGKTVVTNKGFKITGAKYSFDDISATSNTLTIGLKNDHSSNENDIDSTVEIQAGNAISFSTDSETSKVSINADTVDAGTITLNEDGTISLSLQDKSGANTFGDDGIISTDAIQYFVGGTAYVPGKALPVYTKTEVDNFFRGLDALHYEGTVGTGGTAGTDIATLIKDNNIASGYTYLIVSDVEVSDGIIAKKGDLIIAQGTESTEGDNIGFIPKDDITWNYIPSGDDQEIDTTYTYEVSETDNSVSLVASTGQTTGSHSIVAATNGQIVVTSTASGGDATNGILPDTLVTSIKHGTISKTADHDKTIDKGSDFTSITAITNITDDNGHITAVVPSTFGLRTYTNEFDAAVVSTPEGSDTTTATFTGYLKAGTGATIDTFTQKFSSSTLAIATATGNDTDASAISIDLQWGTFE